ncbi:MAG: hypothetical protein EZS26_000593 [Candidatus Ordinivivax streblomastigis]|uniref:Uncharacterized protein n=1 Tax=Candidatus Ordinivivax streblomastigis TaxID=2540710 RepID=A0A5M8P4A8_9BACT|nr:MAG: hypothetical protein EZS26_000374 [Candidatus Ordinivivax streblomastigis]KAA6303433.1 MAG: hypothetical protein EZS26_000593 [Candidatus Ordinivivax streblomastigis]
MDTAYLLIKWTDEKRAAVEETDSLLLWGYLWNSKDTKTSLNMIRTVANSDERFLVLLQNADKQMGYTVDGIGYNYDGNSCDKVPVAFDYSGASIDTRIAFNYVAPPNTTMGQDSVPYAPQAQADAAISAANSTGIIEHPFDVIYGYSAYDYDHWALDSLDTDSALHSWQAGWYDGYWTFYTGENRTIPTTYSGVGVSSRVLQNQSTDDFAYTDFSSSQADMSGDYFPAPCDCLSRITSKSKSKK